MDMHWYHWAGSGVALFMLLISLLFWGTEYFFLIIGFAVIFAALPFVLSSAQEVRISAEKEEMFLEFARNLVESVKTGTPISKSILNVKHKSYGVLTENVTKLANQISLGIPLQKALQTFAQDINNRNISRAIKLIGQAERAGGDIGEILEAVAEAVSTTDKLKKERKAAISTLVVQGYIIFLVFLGIILVMQFQILPMITGIADVGEDSLQNLSQASDVDVSEFSDAFLYLLLIQGFFSGLVIGKLSEGSIKAGIKHSFVMMLAAFLLSVTANILFGSGG